MCNIQVIYINSIYLSETTIIPVSDLLGLIQNTTIQWQCKITVQVDQSSSAKIFEL